MDRSVEGAAREPCGQVGSRADGPAGGERPGLPPAVLIKAAAGFADFRPDGSLTFHLGTPVEVQIGMALRGKRVEMFSNVELRPLRHKLNPRDPDRLLSALAEAMRKPHKVAKRFCRALSETDYRHLLVLLGWALMVTEGCARPEEVEELLASLKKGPA